MPILNAKMGHQSGIPLGGIGTGTVEIRPDGAFHEWQIFNIGKWAPYQPEGLNCEGPNLPPDALAFYLRVKTSDGEVLMRRLNVRNEEHNLYHYSWLMSVEEIAFNGAYPVATLNYIDNDLPIELEAIAFSPFIPHDSKVSGTPGFYFVFWAINKTDKPVEVAILATLKNPISSGAENRELKNEIIEDGAVTYLVYNSSAAENDGCRPTQGSMALSAAGGDISYTSGEFPLYYTGYGTMRWGGFDSQYGMSFESLFYDFRDNGKLRNSKSAKAPFNMVGLTNENIDTLSDVEIEKLFDDVLKYSFAMDVKDRIEKIDKEIVTAVPGKRQFIREMRDRVRFMSAQDEKCNQWGDGALCSSFKLAGKEEKEIRFTCSWYFPYHFSVKKNILGHMYENWFADALAVNKYLSEHYAVNRLKTLEFTENLYSTNLDADIAESWGAQLSTLTKCTWWTKAGDFAVWEGLGCCGFHTTDITYQGSFNILALFPDLQLNQMLMGAKYQREDGRVHHFFTPDLSEVDNGFDRVDMNQQFVLLVCRDYMWTGDEKYLKEAWPHVLRAMDNTEKLDMNGDGLPDHDTARNTYDCWDFFGTPSYIASLWLSALLAAIRLGEAVGDDEYTEKWRKLHQKASVNFDKLLWNGEYYSLWVDGDTRDECCMSDQIDGEWFTSVIGLGFSLPIDKIRQAMGAVMRYNYHVDGGLINASYPPDRKPRTATYKNFQALATWTGIEYAMASFMIDAGMSEQGVQVVKNIHRRHLRSGRCWNHVECGEHYYRAMSSWAILLSITGFKIDLPLLKLSFSPVMKKQKSKTFFNRRVQLGDILVSREWVTSQQFYDAEKEANLSGKSIGQILMDTSNITQKQLLLAYAEHMGLEVSVPMRIAPDPQIAGMIPEKIMRKFGFIPLRNDGNKVLTAARDPQNIAVHELVKDITGYTPQMMLATSEDIDFTLKGGRVPMIAKPKNAEVTGTYFRAPWFSANGWGKVIYNEDLFMLSCLSGEMKFKTLSIPSVNGKLTVEMNGREINHTIEDNDGFMSFEFNKAITLKKGDTLLIL